jgi:hypothetical protein
VFVEREDREQGGDRQRSDYSRPQHRHESDPHREPPDQGMEDLNQLATQVEAFMLAPAFMAVFGSRCDASTADADGIVHVANRLMDYHERFLELAERCRDFAAPSQYTDLMRYVRELMGMPLDAYNTFIDDFVDRIAEMPELIRHARGTVEADPVVLHMHVDDRAALIYSATDFAGSAHGTPGTP